MTENTNKDTLYHNTYWIRLDGIHHIILLPKDNGSYSMRYKSSIVVSVTLILEEFEYVAFKSTFDYRMPTWKICPLPCFTYGG
jgi:hypothetical protein